MKLVLNDFGALKHTTTIEPRPLTIFCGANNTGKTYALYLLYALMDGRLGQGLSGEQLKKAIPQFFAAEPDFASESVIDVQWPAGLGSGHHRPFLLPAERSGINLFFRELNARRATLMRAASMTAFDTSDLLKEIVVSRYAQPIQDYIEFLNQQPEIKRSTSEFADLATYLQKEVLKASYKIDRHGDISIKPKRSKAELGLHLGSSAVKTFFGLWSYLNHLARPGDWLMIDEPELNLHPSNQRIVARLLAQLVNRGVQVVVSTHTDYMVREWGNLLMLGEDFPARDALIAKHGLEASQLLKASDVAAYEFDHGKAEAMQVSHAEGISTKLFDQTIESLNSAAQDIYFARQASQEEVFAPAQEQA